MLRLWSRSPSDEITRTDGDIHWARLQRIDCTVVGRWRRYYVTRREVIFSCSFFPTVGLLYIDGETRRTPFS